MLKLKNYTVIMTHFVLFITFLLLFSGCKSNYEIVKIEGKQIGISDTSSENAEIENFIKPYRDHINKDLDSVLAFCPETLDKSKGEWQTNIGNFMADVCLSESNKIFNKRYGKNVDICLLNHGGIRSIIPKGNVTTRTAFEVMPFENNMVVAALKGSQIMEMVHYLIAEKKPHPLSGMQITLDKNKIYKSISVNGQPLELDKIYYVATSDYLVNGGDNMNFFQKNTRLFDLDYKIRNVLIDYFKAVDVVEASSTQRIIVDQN
ncbi:MAG TPA: 5'-nucleotidase [Flavobacterium sp.]|uniref:5'-nucleotidase C-terminal domain-containing protein n=1 Tax=unclassified Flavobacterium TaxID=196869 RepID=UPI0025B8179B|nr:MULTISPECIES: 5'-nucleotidase [unclassified Flavobacterium]HRE77069.1 5'-nucleotidase [Flavobacterium sp.]